MRPITPTGLPMRKSPQRPPLKRSYDNTSVPIFVPKLPSPILTAQSPSGQIIEIGSNLRNWHGILTICAPQKTIHYEPKEISIPNKIEAAKASISLIQISYRAYDGSPIYIVPKNLYTEVATLFVKGQYGVDTESDYNTGDLRLIQIYNGSATYIFGADALDCSVQIGLPKFFRSKDRIKIGVDIETDVRKITKYMHRNKKLRPEDKFTKPYHVSGIMDVQNIARTMGETRFSLDYLGKKYVPGFLGNPSNHDSYLNPTPEQYIYAANDAIVSLQIYQGLIKSCSQGL